MSTSEKAVNENLSSAPEGAHKESALDSLFEERDSIKSEDLPEEKVNAPEEKKSAEVKKPVEQKSLEKKESVKEKEKESEKPVLPEEKDEDDDREIELSKLKKALNDSQKWGHTNNKRLKGVSRVISDLKNDGVLTDDEFEKLSSLLQSDPEEEAAQEVNVSSDPLISLIQIANKRVSDLADLYEDDPLFNKKIEAFDLCINHSSEQERDAIYEELSRLQSTPFKLVKKMFQIGEKYYNEGYKELDEAGGLKEFISLKNSEIERMKRKLDKLERKLSEYNDYDKPNFKIDELGDTNNVETTQPGSVLDQAIEERDRKTG